MNRTTGRQGSSAKSPRPLPLSPSSVAFIVPPQIRLGLQRRNFRISKALHETSSTLAAGCVRHLSMPLLGRQRSGTPQCDLAAVCRDGRRGSTCCLTSDDRRRTLERTKSTGHRPLPTALKGRELRCRIDPRTAYMQSSTRWGALCVTSEFPSPIVAISAARIACHARSTDPTSRFCHTRSF